MDLEGSPGRPGYSAVPMKRRHLGSVALALVAALSLAPGARAAGPASRPLGSETFVYRWELRKLASLLGGILVPGQGTGRLTYEERPNGNLTSELLITSSHSAEGEFWRYGAEIDPRLGRTVRAWSSYFWRGKTSSQSAEIDEAGVIDVASGIYQIRRDPPTEPRRMRIWSDGRIYPVEVEPMGEEMRRLPSGHRVQTRHYVIHGLDLPGERHWKGQLELWLAEDDVATPVEIQFNRSLMGVRLRLAGES